MIEERRRLVVLLSSARSSWVREGVREVVEEMELDLEEVELDAEVLEEVPRTPPSACSVEEVAEAVGRGVVPVKRSLDRLREMELVQRGPNSGGRKTFVQGRVG